MMVMIVDNSFRLSMNRNQVIIKTMMEFHCIPLEEKPQILLEAWFKFFAIRHDQPENSNELFQKLLEDLKNLAETSQDFDIHQLIEECSTEISEEQKQSMEDTMLELVKICQEKEFLCIHDNVEDLIKSAHNYKLLLINSNSQRLDKKEQEVKNVVEQPAEHGNNSIQSLQNFRVVHKSSIFFKNTSQISSIHVVTPILSTKEPEHSLKDKKECDVPISENSPICNNHSDIFSDFKIDDDISVYDDDFEDIEYVEASLFDPEIVNVEEENVVQQEEEEDNPSVPRPPPEPPDDETDAGEEIPVVMNDKDEEVNYSSFIFLIFDKVFSFLSAESEDTIFDP
nr:hypothetical protein [Tanacetum cinerariifolium]